MAKDEETLYDTWLKRAKNNPVIAGILIVGFVVAAVLLPVTQGDEVRHIFSPREELPSTRSAPPQPPAEPRPDPPAAKKPEPVEPPPPQALKADAPKPAPKPTLVTEQEAKAIRSSADRRVTFSMAVVNESDETVHIQTHQTATHQTASQGPVPVSLEEPDGSLDLGPREKMLIGTWIEFTQAAFDTIQDTPNVLLYTMVISYLDRGKLTTLTVAGSPDRTSDNLNITRRAWATP